MSKNFLTLCRPSLFFVLALKMTCFVKTIRVKKLYVYVFELEAHLFSLYQLFF